MPDSNQFPLGAKVTLAELEADVHTVMHRLRSIEPVSFLPAIAGWLITRHDDASTVMRDAQTYTVDHPGFTTAQVIGQTMLSLDGDSHQQHRRPFEPPFSKRAIATNFTDKVATHVDHLLDKMAQQGQAELMDDFAGPIAVMTMQSALGMEDMSVAEALAHNDRIIETVTRLTAGESSSGGGGAAFAALRERSVAGEFDTRIKCRSRVKLAGSSQCQSGFASRRRIASQCCPAANWRHRNYRGYDWQCPIPFTDQS